jgi:hypothetical protein
MVPVFCSRIAPDRSKPRRISRTIPTRRARACMTAATDLAMLSEIERRIAF